MKKFLIAVLGAAVLFLGACDSGAAGRCRAETGPNPTIDQLCMNPAFVNGHHTRAGKHVNHHALCRDAVLPPDYN